MIAAATFAYLTGKKVAGIYDHAAARDLRIAAEFRGDQLQGFDGDRQAKFSGTLPEIHDAGDGAFISFVAEKGSVQGYDRGTSQFYSAHVTDGVVNVYDYGEEAWFAYDIQDADRPDSYHRTATGAS